ncbi:MAG: glycerol-3-phosphate dehydrogenase/oxidase [Pseudomonadota bacterium]
MTQDRLRRLERLRRKERPDVLVLGAGINGISIFRELALQGVDVVLVDRGDFMSGASAAPSRMIHGGLRYMENGEFGLVRESLRERNALLANAPHYVRPLPTLIPLTDHVSGVVPAIRRFLGGKAEPGKRGSVIVRLGLTLYDLYAGAGRVLPRHHFLDRRALRARWPALRPDAICGAVYHDARITYPERLGIELILDTEAAAPQAFAVNHVGLAARAQDRVVLRDSLTDAEFAVAPRIIVNATGAWIDRTNGALAARSPRLIGGTKGSHLVIDNDALKAALGDTMVYYANHDGRVCIVFRHLGHVLAGSTDIRVDTPDNVRCDEAESAYILAALREIFPAIAISEADIIYRFAGVRPLPASATQVNAEISRDHRCEWLAENAGASMPVLNLIGGKWTTFRAFGAEAADAVLARLGLPRRQGTQTLAIGGGRNFPADESAWIARAAAASGLPPERVARLLERYGTRAEALCGTPDATLQALPGYSRREVEWLIENEQVTRLADLVLRRMAVAMTAELSLAGLEELAAIAAAALGWDGQRRASELAGLRSLLARDHGLTAEMLRRRNPEEGISDVRQQESAHEPAVSSR